MFENFFSFFKSTKSHRKDNSSDVDTALNNERRKVAHFGRRESDGELITSSVVGFQMHKIYDEKEIPTYKEIITLNGKIQISETAQDILAAVETGPMQAIIILNGDGAATSYEFGTLRSHLRNAGYSAYVGYIVTAQLFNRFKTTKKPKTDDGSVNRAEAVRLFDSILEAAIDAGASDIHVCVRDVSASVMIRQHGILIPLFDLNREVTIASMGVVYNKLAIETSRSKTEPQFSQDASQYCMIDREVRGLRWRFRYQSGKVEGGFDVVIRILRSEAMAMATTLNDLGYEPSQQELLHLSSLKSVGATFVAGVTGSGKSTTLVSLMTLDPQRKRYKSYSIEDPVEYRIYGVSQIPIRRDISQLEDAAPFAEAMRVIMRQDPDTIMVGEIRDRDTAEIFAPVVQSGHRALTTVHAASAFGIIDRLSSAPIHMPRAVLAGKRFISALIYQALIPKICPFCSVKAEIGMRQDRLEYFKNKFSLHDVSNMRCANDAGCPRCKWGRFGQTIVAEIVIPTTELLLLIREGFDIKAELLWRKTRRSAFDDQNMDGKTAFEHGVYKVLQGVIDLEDLERQFESIKTYEIVPLVVIDDKGVV